MIALPDLPASVGSSGDPGSFLPRTEVVEMLMTWATAIAASVHESLADLLCGVAADAQRVVSRLLEAGREVAG